MSSVPKVDEAVAILRKRGCQIGMGAVNEKGMMLVEVDGVLLTYAQLYEKAGLPLR